MQGCVQRILSLTDRVLACVHMCVHVNVGVCEYVCACVCVNVCACKGMFTETQRVLLVL